MSELMKKYEFVSDVIVMLQDWDIEVPEELYDVHAELADELITDHNPF